MYTPDLILRLRALVKNCRTWLEARDKLEQELHVHPDNITKMNKRHGFWGKQLPAVKIKPEPQVFAPRPLKRLFLDLETSPNVVLSWRIGYKINLDHSNILKERAVICACWSWEGETKVHAVHWDKDQDDECVLKPLLEAMNEADELVYHNGARFDLPWVKTRCLFHELPTLPAYKSVDTLTWARRHFYFNSNRLDYIAKFLGIGGKIKTEFGLWKAIVLDHDADAMRKMVTYCQHDVVLLKKVWKRLKEVMPQKTHVGVLQGKEVWSCPHCGSTNVRVDKKRVTANGGIQYQMRCNDCKSYYTISPRAYDAYRAAKA